jgi:hypothetical protein
MTACTPNDANIRPLNLWYCHVRHPVLAARETVEGNPPGRRHNHRRLVPMLIINLLGELFGLDGIVCTVLAIYKPKHR